MAAIAGVRTGLSAKSAADSRPVREAEVDELGPGLEVEPVELRGLPRRRAGRGRSASPAATGGPPRCAASSRWPAAGCSPRRPATCRRNPATMRRLPTPRNASRSGPQRSVASRRERRRGGPGQLVARRRLGDEARPRGRRPDRASRALSSGAGTRERVDPGRHRPLVGPARSEEPALDGHGVSAFPRRRPPDGRAARRLLSGHRHGVRR